MSMSSGCAGALTARFMVRSVPALSFVSSSDIVGPQSRSAEPSLACDQAFVGFRKTWMESACAACIGS